MPRRPNAAADWTKVRSVREGPLWEQAKQIAESRGETLTDVIHVALERYVKRHGPHPKG